MESHLLQMRGLKQHKTIRCVYRAMSHLLQMRGLKLCTPDIVGTNKSRIFYRCVD